MKFDSRNVVLFDKRNIDINSFYSLANFIIEDQVTISAVNLDPEDVITFEVTHLKSGAMPEICGCTILPGDMPATNGATVLLCDDCDEDGVKLPVRLTANNPVVVLDSPQGLIIRAVYDGDGIGESTVWMVTGTETVDLTPPMSGCPTVCCIPDPDSWQPTGLERCDEESEQYELQMIDNCGNVEWHAQRDTIWTPTGAIRCEEDWDLAAEEPGTTSVQEISECGDLRWVEGPAQRWTATGVTRCPTGNEEDREIQMVNQCGDLDWITEADQEWQRTGKTQCVSDFEIEDGELTNVGTLIFQEVNQCGYVRWTDEEPQRWAETGELRCVPGSEEDTERQLVNDCGDVIWLSGPAQVWSRTGQAQCSADFVIEAGELTEPGTIVYQEVNQCGNLRWSDEEPQRWVDTGEIRCVTGSEEDTERKLINDCGDVIWLNGPAQEWTRTGEVFCNSDFEVESGELTEVGTQVHKEVNQCGNVRWVDEEPQRWVATGELRCADDSEEDTYRQFANRCGDTVWLTGPEQEWVDTGVTRCKDHLVQLQQVNQCNRIRWIDTEETCGYLATFPLPCGGSAFRPTDLIDPEATVEIADCDGEPLAYAYPEPRPGATTPIMAGCDGCGGELLGYAVDTPSSGSCQETTEVEIRNITRQAVQLIDRSGADYVLWSDGKLRPLEE